jgi:hypothetical protein
MGIYGRNMSSVRINVTVTIMCCIVTEIYIVEIIHTLFCSPWMIKRAGHGAQVGRSDLHTRFTEKTRGEEQLGRPRHR